MGYAGFDLPLERIPGAATPDEDRWERSWGELLDELESWIEARLSPDERGLLDIVSEVFDFRASPPEESLDFLFGDWVPIAVFAGSHWYRAAVLALAEPLSRRLEAAGYRPDLQSLRALPDRTRLYIRGPAALAVDAPDAPEAASWEGSLGVEELDPAAAEALFGDRCPCGVCASG